MDEDGGCKARLAKLGGVFLFTSRAFEVSAVSAARNVRIMHRRDERAAEIQHGA